MQLGELVQFGFRAVEGRGDLADGGFMFEVGSYRFEEFEEQGIGLPDLSALPDLGAIDLHQDQFDIRIVFAKEVVGEFKDKSFRRLFGLYIMDLARSNGD